MGQENQVTTSDQQTQALSNHLIQLLTKASLGQKLAIFRTALNLKQKDLAKQAGVRQADISHAETNPDKVKFGALNKIIDALGLKLVGSTLMPDDSSLEEKDPSSASIEPHG